MPLGSAEREIVGSSLYRRVDFLAVLDFGGLAKTTIGPVDITGRVPIHEPRNESWMRVVALSSK